MAVSDPDLKNRKSDWCSNSATRWSSIEILDILVVGISRPLECFWNEEKIFSRSFWSRPGEKLFFPRTGTVGRWGFKDSTLRTNRSRKKKSGSGWKTSWNPIFFKSKAFESYIHSILKNAQTFYQTPSGRGVRASNRFSIFQIWIRNCHFGGSKNIDLL